MKKQLLIAAVAATMTRICCIFIKKPLKQRYKRL